MFLGRDQVGMSASGEIMRVLLKEGLAVFMDGSINRLNSLTDTST